MITKKGYTFCDGCEEEVISVKKIDETHLCEECASMCCMCGCALNEQDHENSCVRCQ